MVSSEQIKDFHARLKALRSYLRLSEKRIQLANEEERTVDPTFWEDSKKAEQVMKKIREMKYWIQGYESMEAMLGEVELSVEFYREGELTEAEVNESAKKLEEALSILLCVNERLNVISSVRVVCLRASC